MFHALRGRQIRERHPWAKQRGRRHETQIFSEVLHEIGFFLCGNRDSGAEKSVVPMGGQGACGVMSGTWAGATHTYNMLTTTNFSLQDMQPNDAAELPNQITTSAAGTDEETGKEAGGNLSIWEDSFFSKLVHLLSCLRRGYCEAPGATAANRGMASKQHA